MLREHASSAALCGQRVGGGLVVKRALLGGALQLLDLLVGGFKFEGGGAFCRCRWVPARVINAPPLGGALGRVPGTRRNAPNGEP